jgi:hypothetical protein
LQFVVESSPVVASPKAMRSLLRSKKVLFSSFRL